jgi:DNA-binding transcriptional regulator YiaG
MKQARKSKKISRRDMAKRVGMSENTLKYWEQYNKYPMAFIWLWRILKESGMTFEELMKGE